MLHKLPVIKILLTKVYVTTGNSSLLKWSVEDRHYTEHGTVFSHSEFQEKACCLWVPPRFSIRRPSRRIAVSAEGNQSQNECG